MNTRRGYTLVELMIVISITSLLIGIGASSYGQARDRQQGEAAGEAVVSTLLHHQQLAKIGNKDCDGKYLGQRITTSPPNRITATSICEGDEGTPIQSEIPNISSITPVSINLNPLSQGITLPSDPLHLDFVSLNSKTYRISLTRSGTIEYKGIVP